MTVIPQYDPVPPARPPWVAPLIAVVFLALGALIAIQAGQRLGEWSGVREVEAEIEPGLPVRYEVNTGATARSIGRELADLGVIASAQAFVDEVAIQDVSANLQAGFYDLETGMGIEAVLAELVRGPVGGETFRLTVVEGLWVTEILDSLADQTQYSTTELTTTLLSGRVTSELMPKPQPETLRDWEGLLFPDTYEFFVDASPETILNTLADTMEQRVESVDWSQLDDFGVDLYEAIIIASLIEAEAKLDEDRPLISSVIYNRLAIGQGLNIDAALVYAKGVRGPPLSADRQIDSLYNSYLYAGLPPTPIGSVRRASLEAASDPAETNFYYYVVVNTEGGHGFSETLEEHNRKVARAREEGII